MAVFVVLSAWIGYEYWQSRGETSLAVATIGAELIAFAGLAIARHNWRASRKLALLGIVVTLLAAAWCGFTTWQKIDADTRAQALADARERPAYVFAARALESASSALEGQMARQPPACTCPDTIRAWEESQTAAINRLVLERDTAQARLDVATPRPETDWIAIIRGAGMEAVKLLGFMVFGLMVAPSVASASQFAPHAKAPWLKRVAAFASLAWLSHGANAPPAAANEPMPVSQGPDPIVLSSQMDAKAVAFSMRGRFAVQEIAAKVGVHQATVYRWFAKRDLQAGSAA